ncbi:hypothetical protein FXE67_09380 [Vibrio cholerae]|uniref:Uncharacterized protein n=1 Tax=Vibrio cholerae TaxID=666 RepID=A0A8B5ZJC6_VIBCL|nr:hypothetical protein FXE92_14865 [Vibrio cholerae]TXY92191.1 hypothetical protein FXE67_09380 [Vibrio cholerae]TXZ60555.1 hypothetical protein FXE23_12210 [Vibrio cholerae]
MATAREDLYNILDLLGLSARLKNKGDTRSTQERLAAHRYSQTAWVCGYCYWLDAIFSVDP